MQNPDFLELLVLISIASPIFTWVTFSSVLGLLVITLLVLRSRSKQKAIEKVVLSHHRAHNQVTPSPPQRPEIRSSVINMNMDELLDIEEALLALRELYHRKLINAQVYVDESMKHSERIRA